MRRDSLYVGVCIRGIVNHVLLTVHWPMFIRTRSNQFPRGRTVRLLTFQASSHRHSRSNAKARKGATRRNCPLVSRIGPTSSRGYQGRSRRSLSHYVRFDSVSRVSSNTAVPTAVLIRLCVGTACVGAVLRCCASSSSGPPRRDTTVMGF